MKLRNMIFDFFLKKNGINGAYVHQIFTLLLRYVKFITCISTYTIQISNCV
jgi:hypothetical protein